MITTDTYTRFRTILSLSDEIEMSGDGPADDELLQNVLPSTTEEDGTLLKPGTYIARLLGLGWTLHSTWGSREERMGNVPDACHFTKSLAGDPDDMPVYALADYVNGQAQATFYRTQIELWNAMGETYLCDLAIGEGDQCPGSDREDGAWMETPLEFARPTGWTVEDEITAQAEYHASF